MSTSLTSRQILGTSSEVIKDQNDCVRAKVLGTCLLNKRFLITLFLVGRFNAICSHYPSLFKWTLMWFILNKQTTFRVKWFALQEAVECRKS